MYEPADDNARSPYREDRVLTILVVEDDRIERMFMEEHIKELGHAMVGVENGQLALEKLREMKDGIDVILMDRMMPVMDGITAVRRIKEDRGLRRIPIIMVTGAAGPRDIQEGIDAGVFYYLTKPVNEDVLKSVLAAATREAAQNRTLNEELGRHKSSFNLMETCKFRFRTVEDAESLAAFMAHCFPDPGRVLPGLAELMVNAVEHGICSIGYHRKTELIESGMMRDEVKRRLALPENAVLMAEAVITNKPHGIYATITDPGTGFSWESYMAIEPSRARNSHGRGIAQANAFSFDKLTYNDTGNQAIAYVSRTAQLQR